MTSLIEGAEKIIREGVDTADKIKESDLYKAGENIFNNTKKVIDGVYKD